jgi:hypothetical protein
MMTPLAEAPFVDPDVSLYAIAEDTAGIQSRNNKKVVTKLQKILLEEVFCKLFT